MQGGVPSRRPAHQTAISYVRGSGTTIASLSAVHRRRNASAWQRIRALGWRFLVLRTGMLVAGWWILGEGRSSPAFGVAVVAAGLVASVLVPPAPPPRWHALGLLRFGLVFVSGSIRGGLDVARRALAPRLPIAPEVLEYTLRLADGPARNLFLGAVSLMPGTLCLEVDGGSVGIHVLAHHRDAVTRELDRLERHAGRALGVPLESAHA